RQRWVAVRVLGQLGSPQSRDVLVSLLDDGMPALRAAAASGLGDLGDKLVTERLCDLLEDESLLVRATASDALGAIGDARAVEPLARSLAAQDNYYRGQSLWVRRHYVEALGEIGHKTAIPALLQGLDDVDNDVVRASVLAMEDIAGFSYADGRDFEEERRAWQRWASSQIQSLR
ncbi:MAG: HEAT repeat domain-containing protein, partial [Myxococcota bacterium]|nr:HEAT repeat domain-containing protein [Myxococcota bacterium]